MLLKRLIGAIGIIQMAAIDNLPHQLPGELSFWLHPVAPVLLKAAMCLPQLIGRNRSRNVMRNVDADIVTEPFNPARVVAVNRA